MRTTRLVIAPELTDPFARTTRWPGRLHPRRDDNGHDGGGTGPAGADAGTDSAATDTGDPDTSDDPKDVTNDDPKDVDWKAMARKHEREAKANRAAAAELEKIRAKNRTAEEKAQKERDDARAEAEAAKAEAARERAARKYQLSDEDLELLAGTPADQFDAKAKKLSERIKAAAPAGRSGNDVGGGKSRPSDETDPRKLADAAAKRRGTFY